MKIKKGKDKMCEIEELKKEIKKLEEKIESQKDEISFNYNYRAEEMKKIYLAVSMVLRAREYLEEINETMKDVMECVSDEVIKEIRGY